MPPLRKKRTKLGQGLFNIKSNVKAIMQGTPAQQGSLAWAVQTGIKKIKESERFKKITQESPLAKAVQGKFKEIPKALKESLADITPKTEEEIVSFGTGFGVGSLKAPTRQLINEAKTIIKNSSVVQKLVSAIKKAKPARKELAQLQTAERAKRTGAVAGVFEQAPGEKGYFEALGKLKGELVPEGRMPKFEGLRATELVENKLSQTEIDELFKNVQNHPNLDVYEKLNASSGLMDLLEGKIPQKSKLFLLEDTFGSDLINAIKSKRTFGEKLGDIVVDVLNIPRSLITSFDMSAPLRQGIIFTVTKPKAAVGAFGQMFKQVFSQKNFDNWIQATKASPEYKLMKKSNLYIADPTKVSGGLNAREESFMSNLAEKIPIIGAMVKASGRAYAGYLNKLRVDVFNNLSKKMIADGVDPGTEIKVFEDLADFVNNATGRGNLGRWNRAGAVLNNIFFSPRLIASRFNLLNPVWYINKSPRVRKEAIKTFAQFIGFGATVLTLAKMGGADVEVDPRSTDWGKIKVGNTRWDIWGGFQQWVRMFAQMATGRRKTARGDIIKLSKKKFPFETRLDVGERFFRGKLAPIPSLGLELMEGQKLFGEALTLKGEALENVIPLYLQDMQEAIDEFGPGALFSVGVPAFFGVGVQTYEEKQKGGNVFNLGGEENKSRDTGGNVFNL